MKKNLSSYKIMLNSTSRTLARQHKEKMEKNKPKKPLI